MHSLPKPNISAQKVFVACAKTVSNSDLSKRLLSIAEEIESAETDYNDHGSKGTLFQIKEKTSIGTVTSEEMSTLFEDVAGINTETTSSDEIGDKKPQQPLDAGGVVSVEQMETLYSGTFVRKTSPLRTVYDHLRGSAPNDICPLCRQRVVKTLDHYLAKSKHPAFAVTPINLIPACSDCNKLKLAKQPATADAQTFHPYFDKLDNETWLVACVGRTSPPSISFSVVPPKKWDEITQKRLMTHFSTFELDVLYAAHAGAELMNIKYSLLKAAEADGASGIRSHLQEQAKDRSDADPNSWSAAMYIALADSSWFCEQGYRTIIENPTKSISDNEEAINELLDNLCS